MGTLMAGMSGKILIYLSKSAQARTNSNSTVIKREIEENKFKMIKTLDLENEMSFTELQKMLFDQLIR